jgi:hypothetical protein
LGSRSSSGVSNWTPYAFSDIEIARYTLDE